LKELLTLGAGAINYSGLVKLNVPLYALFHVSQQMLGMRPVSLPALPGVTLHFLWHEKDVWSLTWAWLKRAEGLMTNNNQISKRKIFQRIIVATIITVICILLSLYSFNLINIEILERYLFKLIVSLLILLIISFILLLKVCSQRKKFFMYLKWESIIILSLAFELIGYWWQDSLFGHIMIFIGFLFFIGGLMTLYQAKGK
jgi:hypothetical protein